MGNEAKSLKPACGWAKLGRATNPLSPTGKELADYKRWILLPEDRFRDFEPPKEWIDPSLGHHQEWLHACKTGAPTLCNFDYSGALVENNLLGTVAFRVGKKLEWDARSLKATNAPEADRYLRKEYREGWQI